MISLLETEQEEEEEGKKEETNPIKNSFKLGFFTLSMLYIQKKHAAKKKRKSFFFFQKKTLFTKESVTKQIYIYIYIIEMK